MVQIHQDMEWNIPLENVALAHQDEGQPDVVAPIGQVEESGCILLDKITSM
jgi:hypothetical protein